MKSERRHELEHNLLANWLSLTIAKVRPHASGIFLAVLSVALVLVVGNWWINHSFAKSGEAWDAYFAAFDDPGAANEFDKVAEQYPHSDVAQWALVTAADLRLQYGCSQLFNNRTVANQELRTSADGYLKVLGESRVPLLRERATFGLARAKESQGDLEDALKSYDDVVKQWPNGAFTVAAQQRIDDLSRRSTKEFYDKFAKAVAKPVPAEVSAATGKGPEFSDKTLPDGPTPPAGGAPKSGSTPAPAATKPADAKK